jgi:cell division protein FtsL
MATVPATRRAPLRAPAPKREADRRPELKVVRTKRRRPRYGVLTAIGIGGVFALFFGLVVFHTLLLQNQRRLDQLDTQVRSQQETYQQLRLEVAQLQSPERILDVATTKLGMVPAQGTTYLTPSGADAVAARQAEAEAQQADDGTTTLSPDGGQGASSGWPQVKPYLGATP